MNKLFVLFLALFSVTSQSQDNFAAGYYIDQYNKKHEGFIEDTNPYNNPEKIYFKPSIDDKINEISIENINEFKITSDYKYVKFKVDYDIDQVVNKSEFDVYGKDPNLKQKTVLLKVLVEGKAILYKAIIDDCVFFYMKNDTNEIPKLLIHRKYNRSNSISENNDFRKQLYDDLKSETLPISEFLNLNFNESDLENVFKKANNQNNSLVEQNVDAKKRKNKLYYKIFAGISSFSAPYSILGVIDLEPSKRSFTNPIIGAEFSNILGVNSGRSELFLRIFYQKVSAESSYLDKTSTGFTREFNLNFDYSTINVTAGYRYAFYKSGRNKFFLDGSFGVSKVLNSNITLNRETVFIQPNPNPDFSSSETYDKFQLNGFFNFGLGYVFNNKYSINFEYSLPKNILNRYVDFSGGVSNFNLFFTYTLN
jgi:hypothetical protein